MPRPMPPLTCGPEAGSSRCNPELGFADAGVVVSAASPATGVDASAACAAAAAGAAQAPSALTMSSAPTGPCGPRFTPPLLVTAQSGLLKSGLENQPPSF